VIIVIEQRGAMQVHRHHPACCPNTVAKFSTVTAIQPWTDIGNSMNMSKFAEQSKPTIIIIVNNNKNNAGLVDRHQVRACNPEAMHRRNRWALHIKQGLNLI
jgi:hypothetical protein